MLALVAEALSLLPKNLRWGVAFSTYFTKLPPGVVCQWRWVADGTPEAAAARNKPPGGLLLDLSRPLGQAAGGPYVEVARTGKMPAIVPPAPAPPGEGQGKAVGAGYGLSPLSLREGQAEGLLEPPVGITVTYPPPPTAPFAAPPRYLRRFQPKPRAIGRGYWALPPRFCSFLLVASLAGLQPLGGGRAETARFRYPRSLIGHRHRPVPRQKRNWPKRRTSTHQPPRRRRRLASRPHRRTPTSNVERQLVPTKRHRVRPCQRRSQAPRTQHAPTGVRDQARANGVSTKGRAAEEGRQEPCGGSERGTGRGTSMRWTRKSICVFGTICQEYRTRSL